MYIHNIHKYFLTAIITKYLEPETFKIFDPETIFIDIYRKNYY